MMRLYKVLQLSTPQKEQLSALWRSWCQRREALSCKLAAALVLLEKNLPGLHSLPVGILRIVNAYSNQRCVPLALLQFRCDDIFSCRFVLPSVGLSPSGPYFLCLLVREASCSCFFPACLFCITYHSLQLESPRAGVWLLGSSNCHGFVTYKKRSFSLYMPLREHVS